METYREYAKKNGHSDEQIEEMVEGLFGADAQMTLIKEEDTYQLYDMGNEWKLYSNNSTYDTCVLTDEEGNIVEEYSLEYERRES